MANSIRADDLRRALDEIPAIDHHAHLLCGDDGIFALGDDAAPLAELLMESSHPEAARNHIRNHPSHLRAMHDLAQLLGTDPNEAAVDEARRAEGHAAYVRRLMDATRVEAIYVDDGLRYPNLLSIEEQSRLTGIRTRRVARIESMVEDAAALWPSFEDVVDHVGKRLEAAVGDGLVALKTIAAYRCGLGLPSPDRAAAQRGYDHWRRSQSHRLVNADVISFFIAEALDVTREACLPIQVHTGLVGTDTNLRDADPALLRTWLNETVPDRVSVVLLHCYPFLREASWLAALYPNVYIDLSMAMQWVAHRGADLILESVDVAPISKLLFATDGFRVPELFFLGAKWWRDALAEAITVMTARGHGDERTTIRYAELVLRENALRVYRDGRDTW